ncbi:MAG: Sec-independent protein translocase TatA [Candidatus Reconcilbacillus cellulovorans]|uniref:Sec-independent protein translocase protein TatA n=1 Tax=Candidatus Reconcilbacillus cellulovorans TaxID=1906605 RepID=A0A2A6DY87_9BACL|nr:MAG: Sec-independent protein translocase TatA [Candidatus Reconcilbacillus cellulovorans]
MSGIGIPGLILILVIALLLFGPRKLPELGGAFGRMLAEFRKGAKEVAESLETEEESLEKATKS